LVLHGLGASHHDWELLTPALVSAGCEVIAPDLPGHGESGGLPAREAYDLRTVFGGLVSWITSLGLSRPPVIVAHSLGGYLALEFALQQSQLVRGLVLISPLFTPQQLHVFARLGLRDALIGALPMNRLPLWLSRITVDLSGLAIAKARELPAEIRRQKAEDLSQTALPAFHLPVTARNLEPDLDRISAPALVIYGRRDRTLAPRLYPRLCLKLPRAEVLALDAGHVLHQTHPAVVNSEILRFIGNL
jgi:pimeloyl-ACP methyl ester carboxylesterase